MQDRALLENVLGESVIVSFIYLAFINDLMCSTKNSLRTAIGQRETKTPLFVENRKAE